MVAIVAAGTGSALPLAVTLLTRHRPVRRSRRGPPLPAVSWTTLLWTVGVARAEELLWRVLAPAAGQAVGWHPAVAIAAALCGW